MFAFTQHLAPTALKLSFNRLFLLSRGCLGKPSFFHDQEISTRGMLLLSQVELCNPWLLSTDRCSEDGAQARNLTMNAHH